MTSKTTVTAGILDQIAAVRQELKDRYSVTRIGIFGSAARGEIRPDSDVDILVTLAEPTFDHYMDLKFRLEDVLNRSVDLVLEETVKPRLKPIIAKEVLYA